MSASFSPGRPSNRRKASGGLAALAVLALAVASCSSDSKASSADTTATDSINLQFAAETEAAAAADGIAQRKVDAPASPVEASADGRAQGALGGASLNSGVGPIPSDRKIIATADLSIRAKDVAAAAARARSIVLGARGYVETEQSTVNPGLDERGHPIATESNVTLRLRVPTAQFDSVMKNLGAIGVVVNRSLGAQDVTSEVVDVDSRVISAKASIARMQVLYEKAQSIADVASIEGELSRRQADLESLLSRQKELANLTSLATISVNIYSGNAPVALATKSAVREAFDDAAGALGNGTKVILVVAAAMLPFVVLALLLWLPVRSLIRSLRRRGSSQKAATLVDAPTAAAAAARSSD